jgi:hypothetical protein
MVTISRRCTKDSPTSLAWVGPLQCVSMDRIESSIEVRRLSGVHHGAESAHPMPFPRSTASIAAPCCSLAASDIEERAGDEGSLGAC